LGSRNNLVLTIDPLTGEAAIQNESPFYDVAIHAYTISSDAGLLEAANGAWNSLQDQTESGWDEADNSNSFRLTEFNPAGETFLPMKGRVIHLGTPVEVSGSPLSQEDFRFELLTSDGRHIEGIVVLGALPNASGAGDYDADDDVDGADFLQWQRSLGESVADPGQGADGNGNGFVDYTDFVIWRSNFGRTTEYGDATIPEPSTLSIVVLLFVAMTAHSQKVA
jgi:hypothetical protein